MVVLAPEGHDHDLRFVARHAADAVAEESGTVDEEGRRESAALGFCHNFIPAPLEADDSSRSKNPAALCRNKFSIFAANGPVVRDAGGGHHQRAQSAGVWFDVV